MDTFRTFLHNCYLLSVTVAAHLEFAFQNAWDEELNQNLQQVLSCLQFPTTDEVYTALLQQRVIARNEYAAIADERNRVVRAQLLLDVLRTRNSENVGRFIAVLAGNVAHHVLATELTIMNQRARNTAGLPRQV